MHSHAFSTLLASFLLLPAFSQAASRTLRVEASDFPREVTLVSFSGRLQEAMVLRDKNGIEFPIQSDDAGRNWCLLPGLNKGETATFTLVEDIAARRVKAGIEKRGRKYLFQNAGQSLMEFQAEAAELPRADIKPLYIRGAYLHPIKTLSGKTVTDDFPVNHIHHHGVWGAWTKTEFEGRHPDFWNMGDAKGKVEFVAVEKTFGGSVFSGFVSSQRYVDLTAPEPKTALNETWEVRSYLPDPKGRFWMFDLTVVQQCATSEPLQLPEYRYGGIGFRGNFAWNGKDKTQFLTSEGETDRIKGQGTRARWCDISGLVDGARAGITIMCHPENFRAPQPMRLHPDEPFFNYAPQEAGPMEITPGKPYIMRYRFVVHDGAPDKELLERVWNDYAHPAKPTLQ
jgi:hypothetical protein